MGDLEWFALCMRACRAERVPFTLAWTASFPAALPDPDRIALRAALTATADAWRRAFEGEPPGRSELSAVRLAALLAEGDADDDGRDSRMLVGVRCG